MRGSELPENTGPHGVGTTRIHVQVPGTQRRSARTIAVQLWYPTDTRETDTSALGWIRRLAHLTWASAVHDAPLAQARTTFPLIAYVPNDDGRHDDNTFTLANLASHGFVLAALADPFRDAGVSAPPETADRTRSAAETTALLCAHRIRCGVNSASALLDGLEALAPDARGATWAGRLDLARVGILGYALGGAVAAATSLVDPRYVVAANLDGNRRGQAELIKAPYLLMLSDEDTAHAAGNEVSARTSEEKPRSSTYRHAQHQASLPHSHVIEVADTRREHFSDRLVFPSWIASTQQRLPNFKRIRAIIDSYTVAFFRTYLQSAPHPLMCVRHSPYAEVRFVHAPPEYGDWLHSEPAGRG
jgi:dienelactone hydrolase